MNGDLPYLTITAARFAAIQAQLGLSDEALAAKFYRIPDGPRLVREFRLGERVVSTAVACAMLGFEGRLDAESQAA